MAANRLKPVCTPLQGCYRFRSSARRLDRRLSATTPTNIKLGFFKDATAINSFLVSGTGNGCSFPGPTSAGFFKAAATGSTYTLPLQPNSAIITGKSTTATIASLFGSCPAADLSLLYVLEIDTEFVRSSDQGVASRDTSFTQCAAQDQFAGACQKRSGFSAGCFTISCNCPQNTGNRVSTGADGSGSGGAEDVGTSGDGLSGKSGSTGTGGSDQSGTDSTNGSSSSTDREGSGSSGINSDPLSGVSGEAGTTSSTNAGTSSMSIPMVAGLAAAGGVVVTLAITAAYVLYKFKLRRVLPNAGPTTTPTAMTHASHVIVPNVS